MNCPFKSKWGARWRYRVIFIVQKPNHNCARKFDSKFLIKDFLWNQAFIPVDAYTYFKAILFVRLVVISSFPFTVFPPTSDIKASAGTCREE